MAAADIIRGVSFDVSAGSVTFNTVTITAPTGINAPQTGDQIALFIDTRDAYASASMASGWTQRFRPAESSGEGIFYTAKYGVDVTGTSWTWSTGAAATSAKWGWILVVLRGDQVGDYVDGVASARATTGTATPSGSFTPTVPVNMVAFAGDRITGGSTWTWPSGWVEQADQMDSTGTNAISQSAAVYDTTPAAASTAYSVNPTSSTSGSIAWVGILAFAGPPGGQLSGSGTLSASATRGPGLNLDAHAFGNGASASSFGGSGQFTAPTAGQLEVVFATCANAVTITPPAGESWTTAVNVNPDRRQVMFWRIVPASPTNGAFTLSSASGVGWEQQLWSGHDPTTPVVDAAGTSSATASSSIVAPTVTSTRAKSVLLNHYMQLSTASPPTLTVPGGQVTVDTSTLASTYTHKWTTEDLPSAGATGTRTATSTLSQPTGAISAVIQPAIVSASAALSGSGTLTAAGSAPTVSMGAALGGSGTLAATGAPAVARSATLSGSGTLTASSAPAVARSAALSGSGTLSATTTLSVTRSAALSGSGTLQGDTFGTVVAALSGSGTLTASQIVAVARAAALSGSGTLSTTQTVALSRAAALSGTGTLTAIPKPGYIQAAALSGSGTLLAKAVFRLSWWTGTAWARLIPKVWNGTNWIEVQNVTVVDH